MSYSIRYSVRATKELKKLDQETVLNILKVIERIRIRPYSYIQKIVGTEYYRLKVGQYRVILDIINKDLIILIIRWSQKKCIQEKITTFFDY